MRGVAKMAHNELVIAWLNDEIDIAPADIVDAATRHFIATAHR